MKATAELETTSLMQQLEKMQSLQGTCQITLVNACPPEWGVVIVAGGTKFFYRDGTDFTDGPRPLNISAGQSATFMSNQPDECVFQFFIAFNVVVQGQQQTFTNQDGVPAGQCLLHESVTLAPKPFATEGEMKKRGLQDRFVVTKAR